MEVSGGACVRPVTGSKAHVYFLPCSLTIIDIPPFKMVFVFSIKEQVVTYLNPVVARASLVFGSVDCLAAISSYELAFCCVFQQVETKSSTWNLGFRNLHLFRSCTRFRLIPFACYLRPCLCYFARFVDLLLLFACAYLVHRAPCFRCHTTCASAGW